FSRADDRKRPALCDECVAPVGSSGGEMTATAQPATETQFFEDLAAHGHFIPSGELGIYGRGMVFENVRTAFDALVTRVCTPDNAETPRFPPVIPRRTLEKAGYLASFPQLCGVIHSFRGDDSS